MMKSTSTKKPSGRGYGPRDKGQSEQGTIGPSHRPTYSIGTIRTKSRNAFSESYNKNMYRIVTIKIVKIITMI
jgi:hypothetical protein